MPEQRGRRDLGTYIGARAAATLSGTPQGAGLAPTVQRLAGRRQKSSSGASSWNPPEQTRYEMRITGSTVNVSDTLTLPDGHLWDLSVRVFVRATATITGGAGPSRWPSDNVLKSAIHEVADGGEYFIDTRSDPRVDVQVSADIGVGTQMVFSCQVRGSCIVNLNFNPITDPDVSYTLGTVGWYANFYDSTPGALVVATWRRPILSGDEAP